MDIAPSEDNIEWDKLRDNRDLDVIISFDPAEKQLAEENVEITYRREVAVIKMRRMQLRCLAAAFELLHGPAEGVANGTSEDLLPKLISELKNMTLPDCPVPRLELNFPLKSRADSIASTGHLTAFISALQLAYQLAELRRDPQADDKTVLDTMVPFLFVLEARDLLMVVVLQNKLAAEISSVCSMTQKFLDEDSSLLTRRNALENATNCLEVCISYYLAKCVTYIIVCFECNFQTISFTALLFGVYKNLAQPASAQGKKGKKKKESGDPLKVFKLLDFNLYSIFKIIT
jgi:hypothetical protein